jgi:hypothetical protein
MIMSKVSVFEENVDLYEELLYEGSKNNEQK